MKPNISKNPLRISNRQRTNSEFLLNNKNNNIMEKNNSSMMISY